MRVVKQYKENQFVCAIQNEDFSKGILVLPFILYLFVMCIVALHFQELKLLF